MIEKFQKYRKCPPLKFITSMLTFQRINLTAGVLYIEDIMVAQVALCVINDAQCTINDTQ